MIQSKTPEELQIMAEGGGKLAAVRDFLLDFAQAGVALADIDAKATVLISKTGGTPSFQTVDGYRWATCLCVNDVVVHGIPTSYLLKPGDLLTIDVGLFYRGLHTDTAWTKTIVLPESPDSRMLHDHFRNTGERALAAAIDRVVIGNRVGHISSIIEEIIEGSGYHVVRTLVGHGVGKTLHEDPQVSGILKGSIYNTPEIITGMTIAVEVIYSAGSSIVTYKGNDGWTIATRDGSLSAVFEHTVAATPNGPLVLTKGNK